MDNVTLNMVVYDISPSTLLVCHSIDIVCQLPLMGLVSVTSQLCLHGDTVMM